MSKEFISVSKDDWTGVLPDGWRGSTYLNNSIATYDALSQRIQLELGFPFTKIDVTEYQIVSFIDKAISFFSRYAGHEREYFVFCGEMLSDGCGMRLDQAIFECEKERACVEVTEQLVVSSVDINEVVIDTTTAMLSSTTLGFDCEPSSIPLNELPEVPELSGSLWLTYDPANPWAQNICEANTVCLSACSSYDPPVEHSPILLGKLNIKNRKGILLPCNAATKDTCSPLSAWWDVPAEWPGTFEPCEATHIRFNNIPDCSVEEFTTIEENNGRGVKFNVCDETIDTFGDVLVYFQFMDLFDPPQKVLGCHEVTQNGGFRVGSISADSCYPRTPEPVKVEATFSKITRTENYGLSSVSCVDLAGSGLDGGPRKVAGVFSVYEDNNFVGGENLLFNFQYTLMQNVIGNFSGIGGTGYRGGSLVTLNLLQQFIEAREKVTATGDTSFEFNPHTQKLDVIRSSFRSGSCYPEEDQCYIVGVYRERSLGQYLKEPWVQEYAKAIVQIAAGNALTKFQGIQLLGGGTINGNDILTQGLAEKEKLENALKTELDYREPNGVWIA